MAKKTIPAIPQELPAPKLTDQELAIAFAGAAVHANKMFASNMPAGVRLSFCEMRTPEGQDLQFRAGVIISYPDAIALRDLLSRQLEGIKLIEAKPDELTKNG